MSFLPLLALAVPLSLAPAPHCCRVTVIARVPDSTPAVYLTGNLPAFGPWKPDGLALSGQGRERRGSFDAPPGTVFEFKFTLGSWDRGELGYAGAIGPPHRLTVAGDTTVTVEIGGFQQDPRTYIADWRGSGVRGRLVYWTDVHSAYLGPSRHVEIWLPPGYDDQPARHYPVLYMADGQNLFDPRLTFGGIDWGVDEAITALVEAGTIPPLIVVGVWNSSGRWEEYSPWHGAPRYARFLIEELMPRVNAAFRTETGPAHTMVMGSSMGGLVSFYLVTRHPEVFGACGCLSTHVPLSEAWVRRFAPERASAEPPDTVPFLLRDIHAGLTAPAGARYWFDYGTVGLDSLYRPVHDSLRAWLLRQGRKEGRDFVVRRYPGASHSEAAWRARLADPLRFLFSPQAR